MEARTGAVTIYDIAREAGVSPATVSRVINGTARVSLKKARVINDLIEKYDFRPNVIARSLLKKESKSFGVILPHVENPFFAALFIEIENRAMGHGFSTILCNSKYGSFGADFEQETAYLNLLIDRQVDGIVFAGGRVNEAKVPQTVVDEMIRIASKVPLVMVNGSIRSVNCHVVRSAEGEGILQAVGHLVSLGHRRIGFAGGIVNITATFEKIKAFREACMAYDLKPVPKWIVSGSFDVESGMNIAEQLLGGPDRPTALVAVNDLVAIGIMKKATEMGLSIPGDLSVIGFDDTYLCDIVTPTLTSVSHNLREIARRAVDELVFGTGRSGAAQARETVVKPELIQRASTGPCPTGAGSV